MSRPPIRRPERTISRVARKDMTRRGDSRPHGDDMGKTKDRSPRPEYRPKPDRPVKDRGGVGPRRDPRPDRPVKKPRNIEDREGYGPRGPRGPRGCPDPSMLILMADGSQKKAGDLKVGDLVKTFHEKDLVKTPKLALALATGGSEKYSEFRDLLENSYAKASLSDYKVEHVNILKNVEKIKFTFEGSEIVCSLTHKFYVNDLWKEAQNMKIGDEVSGKKLLSIEDVEDGDVVHITVEDAHTYICEGLLSHNKRRPRPDRPRPPEGEPEGDRPVKDKGGVGPRKDTMPRGPRCPDPNMLILMANGSQKKAGDLKVGDLVKTYHEKDLENESKLARYKSLVLSSGDVEEDSYLREQLENSYAKATLGEYKVQFVDIVKNVEKIKLTFEGSEIVCSLTHKFYVNNSWKEAKDMVVGDEVSGKKLLSTQNVEDGDVVHITIEDAHTYICEGLLSHNKRRPPRGPRKPKGGRGGRRRRDRMMMRRRRRRALMLARRRRRRRRGMRGAIGRRRRMMRRRRRR